MSKVIRTPLHLVVSLILFSALALAHAGGSNAHQHKTRNKQHHNPFAKLAFWHHHKDSHRNAKHARHASTKAHAQKASATKTKPQGKAQNRTTASLKQ